MTRRRWTALPATVKGLPAVAMTAALLAAFGQGPPVPAQHPLARAVLTAQQGPPPGPQPPPVDTGLAQRIGRFHSLETDLARAEQTVAAAEAALRAAQFPPAGSPATPRGTLAKLAGRLVKAREAQLSVENKLIAAGQTITAEGVKKAGKLRLSQISEVDAVTAGWRSVSTDQQKRSKDWLDATRPLGKPINIDYQSRSKRIPRMHKSLSGAAASGALDRKYDATLTNPGQGVTKALPPPAAAANKALDALMGGGRIITTPITAWSTRITGSVGLQLFKDPTDSAYYLLIRNKRGKVEVEELPNMVRAPLKFAESPFIPVGSIEGVEYGLVIEGVANTQDAFGLKWEKQLDREGWTAIRLFSLRPGPQVIKGGSDKGQVGKLSRQTTVSTKVDFPVKLAIRLPGQQEAWTLPTVVEAKLSLDVGQHFPKDWSDPAAIARLMELKPTFELVAGVDYNFNTFVKMVTEWMEANHIPVHPGLAQAIGGVFGKVNLSFEKALVLPLHKTGFKGISLPIYSPPGPSLPSGPNTTPAQGGQPIGTAAQPKVAGVRRSGSPVAGPALRPKIAPGRYNAATLKLVDRLTQARLRVQLSNVPGRKQAVELRIGRNTAAWPRPPRWTYETWRVYTPLSTSTLPDVVAGVRDAARLAAKAGARGVVVDLHRNSVTAAQLAAELDALHGQQVSTGPVLIAGESATKGGTDIVRVDDTGGPTTPATCNCFPAGTPVATTAGSVPIQNIRVGDRVWAHDLATGRTEVRRVTALFHRQATRMLTLRVSGGITVRVTPDHPFYVPGRGWVTAEALRPGQPLLRRDGATARLLAVSARDVRTTVYNFSVASDHDYYVSPAQLLVHNCTPTPSPEPRPSTLKQLLKQARQAIDQLRGVKPAPQPNATVGDLRGAYTGDFNADSPAKGGLSNLTDQQLLDRVFQPKNGAHVIVRREIINGRPVLAIWDGNHRVMELQARADRPTSSITDQTPIYIVRSGDWPPVDQTGAALTEDSGPTERPLDTTGELQPGRSGIEQPEPGRLTDGQPVKSGGYTLEQALAQYDREFGNTSTGSQDATPRLLPEPVQDTGGTGGTGGVDDIPVLNGVVEPKPATGDPVPLPAPVVEGSLTPVAEPEAAPANLGDAEAGVVGMAGDSLLNAYSTWVVSSQDTRDMAQDLVHNYYLMDSYLRKDGPGSFRAQQLKDHIDWVLAHSGQNTGELTLVYQQLIKDPAAVQLAAKDCGNDAQCADQRDKDWTAAYDKAMANEIATETATYGNDPMSIAKPIVDPNTHQLSDVINTRTGQSDPYLKLVYQYRSSGTNDKRAKAAAQFALDQQTAQNTAYDQSVQAASSGTGYSSLISGFTYDPQLSGRQNLTDLKNYIAAQLKKNTAAVDSGPGKCFDGTHCVTGNGQGYMNGDLPFTGGSVTYNGGVFRPNDSNDPYATQTAAGLNSTLYTAGAKATLVDTYNGDQDTLWKQAADQTKQDAVNQLRAAGYNVWLDSSGNIQGSFTSKDQLKAATAKNTAIIKATYDRLAADYSIKYNNALQWVTDNVQPLPGESQDHFFQRRLDAAHKIANGADPKSFKTDSSQTTPNYCWKDGTCGHTTVDQGTQIPLASGPSSDGAWKDVRCTTDASQCTANASPSAQGGKCAGGCANAKNTTGSVPDNTPPNLVDTKDTPNHGKDTPNNDNGKNGDHANDSPSSQGGKCAGGCANAKNTTGSVPDNSSKTDNSNATPPNLVDTKDTPNHGKDTPTTTTTTTTTNNDNGKNGDHANDSPSSQGGKCAGGCANAKNTTGSVPDNTPPNLVDTKDTPNHGQDSPSTDNSSAPAQPVARPGNVS